MDSAIVELDCRGMPHPAPIHVISEVTKNRRQPIRLEVRADDQEFADGIQSWCRSNGARLESLEQTDGVFVARISLQSPHDPLAIDATPRVEIDCRGMLCPKPMLYMNRAMRDAPRPSLLVISADDTAFPSELEAWCVATQTQLLSLEQTSGGCIATVMLPDHSAVSQSAPAPTAQTVPPAKTKPPAYRTQPLPSTSPGTTSADTRSPDTRALGSKSPDPRVLDLRGQTSEEALLLLGRRVIDGKQVPFLVDPGPIERHIRAWAKAISARIELVPDGSTLRGWAMLDDAPLDSEEEERTTRANAKFAAKRNKAILLVLHDDIESLMAALMMANASLAQGMQVEVYFAFRAVAALRSTPDPKHGAWQAPLLQGIMKWVASGLDSASRNNLAPERTNTAIRTDNLPDLQQLLAQTAQSGVKFIACTMSMGLMNLRQDELLPLPNLSFGRMTAFAAAARDVSLSLVF